MRIITSIKAMQKIARRAKSKKKTLGFVPTMGALHEGHLSLIRRSKDENTVTVLSIFVNPKQFGPNEDYRRYPRTKKKDELLAKKEKVDIIFYPSAKEMYPTSYLTYVCTEKGDGILCGKFRPGHFKGVTTVVAKLLNAVLPDTMYLGQKDAQQAFILERMACDLNFPVKIKILPTVREKDGLATSSRNQYLTDKQRSEAKALYTALKKAKKKILSGGKNTKNVQKMVRKDIHQNCSGRVEYVECVNTDKFELTNRIKGNILIAVAVWFGKTRLIDNIKLRVK